VSRMYDRILATGCRRATTADFHDLADRVIRNPDWDEFARNISETLIEQGVITQPIDAARAKVLHDAQRATSRYKQSREEFPADDLQRCVVIAGDDVAAYIHSLGAIDLADACSIVAPPFEWCWIECRSPNRFAVHSWGVLIEGVEVSSGDAQYGERWVLKATLVFETVKGDPWGPVADYVIPVLPDGHLLPSDDEVRGTVFGRASPCVGEEVESTTWTDELPGYLFSALLSISFMHCKNVDIVDNDPPPKLSRRHLRKHGRPLTTFKTLNIDPMRQVLDRDGRARETGLRSAVHICRGHFKTFSPDAPLFGKLTGTYWWADHVRGDAAVGAVEKDYRINVTSVGLGRTYVEADESLPMAPEQVGSNPDLSGRGREAHARTQNLLAAALEAAGLTPLSPRPEDPQFDIAWITDNEVWACEVKSLRPQNELSQMHSAIGQVIDYAHRLDDQRPIRKMIAVEQQPTSDHWVAECAAQGIVLVWPDGFAAALSA